MTDEANESEVIELDESGEPKRNFRRVLEERAQTAEARVAELEASLTGLQKAEAFRAAGINPADSRQAYFVKGYDGEVETEAIRAAAIEAGFITDGPPQSEASNVVNLPTGETATLQQELAAQQRIAEAGVQAQPVVPPDLDAQIRSTSSEAELKALMRSQGFEFDVQG
jgi:hypothetical protein